MANGVWDCLPENIKFKLCHEFPLTADSVVYDLGGFRGDWSTAIHNMYGCKVQCYEPIREFYNNIRKNVDSAINVYNHAWGWYTGNKEFYKRGDASGFTAGAGKTEDVTVMDIELIKNEKIDLMKINIEGMEYGVINRMHEVGMLGNIKNILVQFHPLFEDSEKQWKTAQAQMSETHRCIYCYPWYWEHWERT